MQEIRAAGRVGRASSAMAYAVLHGTDSWRDRYGGVRHPRAAGFRPQQRPAGLQKLVAAVFAAYGARRRTSRTCTMPGPCWPTREVDDAVRAHDGEDDRLIPVAEARRIASAMKGTRTFVYHEIPTAIMTPRPCGSTWTSRRCKSASRNRRGSRRGGRNSIRFDAANRSGVNSRFSECRGVQPDGERLAVVAALSPSKTARRGRPGGRRSGRRMRTARSRSAHFRVDDPGVERHGANPAATPRPVPG